MKILLVSSLVGEGQGYLKHGIGLISAVLKQAGHSTTVLHDPNNIVNIIKLFNPDVVGIFGLTHSLCEQANAARAVKEYSKAINKKIPVFVGGPGPSLESDGTYDKEDYPELFDYVFKGEAEITFLEIINNYRDKKSLPDARYITGQVVHDLDALPFVDRRGFNGGETKYPLFEEFAKGQPMFSMLNSRVCRKRCKYCAPATSTIFGNVKKLRSVDHFLAELKSLPRKSTLMIHDDNLIENEAWTVEFMEKVATQDLSRPFICQAYPPEIVKADNLIGELKRVGLVGVIVGFESGSDRVLKFMRKGSTRALNEKAAEVLHKHNLHVQANLMFGLPTETEAEMRETVDLYINHLVPAWPSPAVYTPYPGSEWYDWLRNENMITITDPHQYQRYACSTKGKIKGVDYDLVDRVVGDLMKARRI